MSSPASTRVPEGPQGTLDSVRREQHSAARIAGIAYLVTAVIAAWAEFGVRSRLIVGNDAVRTATNIAEHAQLYRFSIVADLLMAAGVVVLNLALYQLLAPVNRRLALVAASWRMMEVAMHAAIAVSSFVVLRFVSDSHYLQAFEPAQLHALARVAVSAHAHGYFVLLLFFGLGSTIYFWLLLRSRYIPRALALIGITTSALTVLVSLMRMLYPAWEAAVVGSIAGLPIAAKAVLAVIALPLIAFEILTGLWLLVRGVRIHEAT